MIQEKETLLNLMYKLMEQILFVMWEPLEEIL